MEDFRQSNAQTLLKNHKKLLEEIIETEVHKYIVEGTFKGDSEFETIWNLAYYEGYRNGLRAVKSKIEKMAYAKKL